MKVSHFFLAFAALIASSLAEEVAAATPKANDVAAAPPENKATPAGGSVRGLKKVEDEVNAEAGAATAEGDNEERDLQDRGAGCSFCCDDDFHC